MSFLAPLFLAGAAAVILPVVFHLVRHSTRERTVFSSLMFLRPAPPRLTRRNRLEHLLLLLLRCAALALLAAGFARPFLRHLGPEQPARPGQARRLVLAVDTSASMRRSDLWSQALRRAETLLRATRPIDQVAVVAFDRRVDALVSFEEWNATAPGGRGALVRQRLEAHAPGWAATHLDQALLRAAEMAADADDHEAPGPRQVLLLSDLQEGSRLNTLQAQEWPKGVELVLETLSPTPTSNAGLQLLPDTEDAPSTVEPRVRLRVLNTPDSRREQFRIGWVAGAQPLADTEVELHVPAGQSRLVLLRPPPAAAGADRIQLVGDDEPFDNTVFVQPAQAARVSVAYLGDEAEGDSRQPLYFLRRAFQETRRQVVQVTARPPTAAWSPQELRSANLVVVTAPLPPELVPTLREAVGRGGTVLFVLSTPRVAPSLSSLLQTAPLTVAPGRTSGYGLLAEIDFRHPVFAPFADARFSDFSRIHFWRYLRLDPAALPGARVLARFDDEAPLLLEWPLGQGRLLLLTSGWHPDDSQLALSSKFVPLLYAMLELSGRVTAAPERLLVGDSLPIAAEMRDGGFPVTLHSPAGPPLILPEAGNAFSQTWLPGAYELQHALGTNRFVVNLDPAESRTTPLAPDDLERVGAVVHPETRTASAGTPPPLRDAELEARQKLWRWLLIAMLAVLLLESLLAGRTTRLRAQPGGAP